ncbi:hypothetical protein Cantr_09700 [Candida viswanathii]|uniref:Uncharacterized protein n=1 Tax=Candida viswanathii TaxID=5486 RepID=A0A367YBC5_9ASCO|nr:hypothetical protein Cantr_09700 [Candida viswanathii]
MLYALATPGSAFQPSIKKVRNTWRLKKFKQLYIEKGGYSSGSSMASSGSSSASNESKFSSSNSSVVTASSSTRY